MKKLQWILFIVLIVLTAGICSAEAPVQVGPFVLNRPLADCQKYLRMETSLPVRYMEYLHEVEIKPIEGFKSGLVAYAACEGSKRIVRIKLKYADNSRQFYDALCKRVSARFGKSSEYRGDPFHIVIAWKWSFVDDQNNRISMILQHNSRDEEEKMGNSIKLTMTSLMEEQQTCYEEKLAQSGEGQSGSAEKLEVPGLSGWDLFLPR